MFIKKNKKIRTRYTGMDSTPWRVVTFSGSEMGRWESYKDEATNKVVKIYMTRWSGFRGANAAARALGGVAVRA